jgi:hypothetical protein
MIQRILKGPVFSLHTESIKQRPECLLKSSLAREAYLSLIIASECLLKGIFNCLKIELFGNDKNKTQARILVELVLPSKKEGKNQEPFLSEKNFHHDLAKLTKSIKDLFDEFDKGDFSTEFAEFTNAIE